MMVGIDTGGTFTDVVAIDGDRITTAKVPSTPTDFAQGVMAGVQQVRQDLDAPFTLVHATTVATNALLENKLAKVALITTRGFRDVLEIGRQTRPELYNLRAQRPPPLIPRRYRYEVKERVSAEGKVIESLETAAVDACLDRIERAGIEQVAVALLFAFLHPAHERLIGRLARRRGMTVSLSSDILPEFREFERTSTTVVNACVMPVMQGYVRRIQRQVGDRRDNRLRIVQSNGGSLSARAAGTQAVHTLLSGPAAGVTGARWIAAQALQTATPRCITFDMGGTSTDVALLDGGIPITTEMDIAGHPVRVPMLDIHTVGAGGGSIATLDAGHALQVGPASAGAEPGPACYGVGEAPTVTDANLVAGRLVPDHFLGGRKPLDRQRAIAALTPLARQMNVSVPETASSILRMVNANMERAIRVISVERGYDPRQFTLLSFGGAGGLHACALAEALDIPRVLIPRNPGVLSAWGAVTMDVVKDYSQTILWRGDPRHAKRMDRVLDNLQRQAIRDMAREGFEADTLMFRVAADLRYCGQSFELTVPLTAASDWNKRVERAETAFHKLHEQRYGYCVESRQVEWVTLRLQAIGPTKKPKLPRMRRVQSAAQVVPYTRVDGVKLIERDDLRFGHQLRGAALLVEAFATTWIPAGWQGEVDAWGHVHLTPRRAGARKGGRKS